MSFVRGALAIRSGEPRRVRFFSEVIYYIIRDLAFGALQRWFRYLSQGDWPVPRNVLQKTAPNLYRALENRSTKTGDEFEEYVNSKLSEIGMPFARLNNRERVGGETLSREIDAVVVDAVNN